MTVKELIEKLKGYPEGTEIYISDDMGRMELRDDNFTYEYDVFIGKEILEIY